MTLLRSRARHNGTKLPWWMRCHIKEMNGTNTLETEWIDQYYGSTAKAWNNNHHFSELPCLLIYYYCCKFYKTYCWERAAPAGYCWLIIIFAWASLLTPTQRTINTIWDLCPIKNQTRLFCLKGVVHGRKQKLLLWRGQNLIVNSISKLIGALFNLFWGLW